MIWREKQRAMGELALDRDRDAVVGFVTFAARATGGDAKWIAKFIADLKSGSAPGSQRFALIQSLLSNTFCSTFACRSISPVGV